MRHRVTTYLSKCLLLSWFFGIYSVFNAQAQDTGRQARMAAVQAVETMLMQSGADLDAFIDEKLSDEFRASMPADAIRKHLNALQVAVAGAGGMDLARENEDIHLIFSKGADATVILRLADNGKIDALELKEKKAPSELTQDEMMNEARRVWVRGIESLGMLAGDDGLRTFADEHLSEAYRNSIDEADLLATLGDLRSVIAAAGAITVSIVPEGTRLQFRGSQNADVLFTMEEDPPHRIASLDTNFDVDTSGEKSSVEIAPISWDNLEERLVEEEEAGFSGTVLIARDGEIVLHEGYGAANRENERKNTTETVFGIGSMPIDFTRAAILKLNDEEKLSLSDSITRFFDDVPADRRGMTLEHLMTGQSGLPNFHHLPADENRDLTWIDRNEAVRRMMEQPLLFAPGESESHSHSAYVLLAVVIEKVTEQPYEEYLRETFFAPIGMSQTGFYGDQARFNDEEMATGYGFEQVGMVNNARHWGPTSWLMMGAGGMVSTPGDMYKWLKAIHSGEYLSQDAINKFRHGGVMAGASDRGFLMMVVDDPNTTAVVSSNANAEDGDINMAVARALVHLVGQ